MFADQTVQLGYGTIVFLFVVVLLVLLIKRL